MNSWGQTWAGALAVALLGGLVGACAGPVEAKVTVKAPEPVPTPQAAPEVAEPSAMGPTDEDGDGLVGAADRCPDEAETKNDYRDDDGCADEVPPAHVAGDEVRYQGTIAFAATGALDPKSRPVVAAIAKVLAEETAVELVEVGVGFPGDRGDTFATKQRAQVLLDALAKKGVARTRLRSAGYGACGGSGDGPVVKLTVVQKAGAATGATLGCRK